MYVLGTIFIYFIILAIIFVLFLVFQETQQKDEKKEQKGTYLRREFSYTSFRQSFTLPDDVDREGIAATMEHGVLTVDLPKKDMTKETPASRQIEIR